jgi:homoserine O-acetyltransferase
METILPWPVWELPVWLPFGRSQLNDGTFSSSSGDARKSFVRNADAAAVSPVLFSAQSYLRYQGEKFSTRFDANYYLHILDKIDSHDITRGRCSNLSDGEAVKKVLGQIRQPTLVIGVASDGLYPLCEQKTLSDNIPNATFALVESDDGHDGFLLETAQLNSLLHFFFNKIILE